MAKTQKTLREIAEAVGGTVVGDPSVVITGASGIEEASPGDITFLANPRYKNCLEATRASAVIVSSDVSSAKPLVCVKDPSLAFARAVALFHSVDVRHPHGLHPSAVIAKSAKIGRDVGIGAHAVIEEEAEVGDQSILYPGCYVGRRARIGKSCLLWPNVSIRERVIIGDRVVIQSGAVIGSEGFGYMTDDLGAHHLIPQVGTVVIEDDVDIGSNVTIDRARFDKTVVGRGTKIDNLVHIAHNVNIGSHCLIIAQAGISGSTRIGKGVTIAGQAGLVGHITIGDGAICAAQAGVTKSVAPGTIVSGYPARPHEEAKKVNAYIQRLPKMSQALKALEEKIKELQSRLEK